MPSATATLTPTATSTAPATATNQPTATTTTQPALIGDFVWHDLNGDGLQTVGEAPLAGITVTLYSTETTGLAAVGSMAPLTATALMTTVTQTDGHYAFTVTLPGRYFVTFTGSAPFVPTRCNQSVDDASDSDACRVDLSRIGQTAPFTVTIPQTQPDWDAGFTLPAMIRGRAYLDRNRNQQQDMDEAPISGLTIILQEGSTIEQQGRSFVGRPQKRVRLTVNNRELARTITSADGSYAFSHLTPGRYQLVIVLPVGFTAPSTILALPWLNSGELLSEDAGLIALQPTNLTEAPEPLHRLYLPLVQKLQEE